eukprot:12173519-Ditylum_brightwellii.AAC.1
MRDCDPQARVSFLGHEDGMGQGKQRNAVSVFWNLNQALKYVNRASKHRPTTFKFIASGVFT